jgi:hypothetical protein
MVSREPDPETRYDEAIMGIGHVAVGMALKKSEPRLNLGILVFAAFLADFLLGVFALLGWESAHVPANFAQLHYMTFTFPWSHGLVPLLVWSALAALVVRLLWHRHKWASRAAVVVAIVVFSHFILDALVHVRGLPILGDNSWKIGLGLWIHMGIALTVEAALFACGLVLYLSAVRRYMSLVGRIVFAAVLVLLAVVTIAGQATSAAPPPARQMPLYWIFVPLILSALCFAFDRRATTAAVQSPY